jgi:hypothetical protein
MSEHQVRARRERQIAEEIAAELCRALGLGIPTESQENKTVVEEAFTRIFDQYQIADEWSARRILEHTWKALARLNLEFAERNRRLDAFLQCDRGDLSK